MNRVDRLMAYLLLLQSRGQLRSVDFARRFEISERTVYRDIQALSEAGVPIVATPGKGYSLVEGYYLPPVTFSTQEAKAMALAVGMLTSATAPGPTRDAATGALEKVRVVLPASTRAEVDTLLRVIQFYSFAVPKLDLDDRKLLDLQQAIVDRRLVRLRYHALATNDVTERDVEPIDLVLMDRAWMLDAFCRLRQGPRGFRLSRIDAYHVLDERFEPRQMAREQDQDGTLRVLVRFDPGVVRWVHERQHFSYAARESEEEQARFGSETVMVYRPRAVDAIAGWLLAWGDDLEVLAPPELRQHLGDLAKRLQVRYGPA